MVVLKIIPCEAVIFDLDGVLVDSYTVIERYWSKWAARHSLDAAPIMEVINGMRTVDAIRLLAPHLDAQAEAAQIAGGEALDLNGVQAIEGARELLEAIPAERWAVATSGTRRTATTRIAHVDLPFPKVLVTADDVQRGKPDPQVYLLAAERLDIPPEKCVVIEDSSAGVEAALAAGMRVVAVDWKNKVEALAGATMVAARLADIHVRTRVPGEKHPDSRQLADWLWLEVEGR